MLTTTEETNEVVTVVIVEDYKLTRVGLRSTLNEYENINVIGEAEDAKIGLEVIKKEQPDVVLMDLGLPEINGIEATQKVKEISPNTKVIILTSHDREEDVLAALGSGASAYCLKDIDPNTLVSVIKNVSKGCACHDTKDISEFCRCLHCLLYAFGCIERIRRRGRRQFHGFDRGRAYEYACADRDAQWRDGGDDRGRRLRSFADREDAYIGVLKHLQCLLGQ